MLLFELSVQRILAYRMFMAFLPQPVCPLPMDIVGPLLRKLNVS